MRIDLDIGNLGTASSGFRSIATDLDRIAASLQKANAAAGAGSSGGAGGALATVSAPPPGQSRGPRAASDITGAVSRYRKSQDDLLTALNGGTKDQIADAQLNLDQARRTLERRLRAGQEPSFQDRLMDFVGTTRFGGHGAMPLVNRAVRLVAPNAFGKGAVDIEAALGAASGASKVGAAAGAGAGAAGAAAGGGVLATIGSIAAMAGPVGWTVAALILAAEGAKAMAEAADHAAQNLRSISAAAAESGGSVRDVAALSVHGISRDQIAGASGGLRGRLSSDPLATLASAQLGFGPMGPTHIGSQNNAEVLLKHLDALRKVTDAEEQLRLARMLGVESSLDLIRVSDRVWADQKRAADLQARVADPASMQAARDLGGEQARITAQMEALQTAAGKAFIPLMVDSLELLGDILQPTVWLVNELANAFRFMYEATSPLHALMTTLHGDGGPGSAQERNTRAIEENTRVIRDAYVGGGQRFREWQPSGLAGDNLRLALEGGRFRLGAFR